MSEAAEILGALGLELDETPMVVELAQGVRLTGRRPTTIDANRARVAVAEVFDPLDKLKAAAIRYRFTDDDKVAILEPETWAATAEYATAVELAVILIHTIEGPERDGGRASIPVNAATMAYLFRLEDNTVAFMAAASTAGRGLIRPKKDPAPSPNGCSPAGARTAGDAETSADPAPGAMP